ncbi:MAG: stage V sporulation protein AC [Oscillospiraceae bacterium]|nr:stage V sporulation protein AC [Oscillospiraceae bacterium]
MDLTGREYRKMSKKASPPSPIFGNCIKAFLFGGLICTMGQLTTDLAIEWGMTQQDARLAASVFLILLSVILTGFAVYDDIAKHAGAGTLVPITGFANSIVASAIEFKSEGFIMGLGAKMFVIAGPVLVYGITSSILYGVVLYIVGLF